MSFPTLGLRRSRWAGPLLVFVLSLGLTTVAWQLAEHYTQEEARLRFEADAADLERRIETRMESYRQILRSGRSFFLASEEVTRDEWRLYVESLRLYENYPGTQGLGYAEVIPPGGLAAHEARVRAEGFPDYAVQPPGERGITTAIIYLEPFEGRNLRAFGYDMYSEMARREAMSRARDEGQTALSGKVTLVQEDDVDVQPGLLMYTPVYAEGVLDPGSLDARRTRIVGWVYSPFRAHDLMEGILSEHSPPVHFRVYDGKGLDPDSLLYANDPNGTIETGGEPWETRVSTLNIAGRTWTLLITRAPEEAAASSSLLPSAVLLAGIVTSALLSGIALSLHATRERAITIAEGMTSELRAKQRELENSNEALRAFSYVVSHDLKEPVRGVEAYLRVVREDHEAQMDPEAATLVAKAYESTRRLSALLQGLLELSSVDRGTLQPQPVRIDEVLWSEPCRIAFETLQAERGARIEVEPAPLAIASVSVLAQALGNLVANAIRHSGVESPVVLLHGAAGPDGHVDWFVEDNGRGFPEGFAESFNAGASRARGFGMLIAQRALERVGGRLRTGRSERLGGAKAILRLPAAPTRLREAER